MIISHLLASHILTLVPVPTVVEVETEAVSAVSLPVPDIFVPRGPDHLPLTFHTTSHQTSAVLPASDPGDVSLAMPGVTEPVPSVGVTVGENVDTPALPQSVPPGPGVVVRGTAEHSKPVRNLLEVHLEETLE